MDIEVGMKNFPYKITVGVLDHIDDMLTSHWCEKQFGSRWDPIEHNKGKWYSCWVGWPGSKKRQFIFSDERDAVLFALRFS